LTLAIIMDHQARSTTTSKEQFISQMEEIQKVAEIEQEPIDVSIPYDAAAQLAYEQTDKSMSFEDFKVKYLEDSVAHVISKRPVDVSIPYDAAAKLAYDHSDKSMDYAAFKTKFEADAVADVIAKQKPPKKKEEAKVEQTSKKPAATTIDVSVPYDAAAKLAYEKTDKSTKYADFKAKFEADAVADVISKQKVLQKQ